MIKNKYFWLSFCLLFIGCISQKKHIIKASTFYTSNYKNVKNVMNFKVIVINDKRFPLLNKNKVNLIIKETERLIKIKLLQKINLKIDSIVDVDELLKGYKKSELINFIKKEQIVFEGPEKVYKINLNKPESIYEFKDEIKKSISYTASPVFYDKKLFIKNNSEKTLENLANFEIKKYLTNLKAFKKEIKINNILNSFVFWDEFLYKKFGNEKYNNKIFIFNFPVIADSPLFWMTATPTYLITSHPDYVLVSIYPWVTTNSFYKKKEVITIQRLDIK